GSKDHSLPAQLPAAGPLEAGHSCPAGAPARQECPASRRHPENSRGPTSLLLIGRQMPAGNPGFLLEIPKFPGTLLGSSKNDSSPGPAAGPHREDAGGVSGRCGRGVTVFLRRFTMSRLPLWGLLAAGLVSLAALPGRSDEPPPREKQIADLE